MLKVANKPSINMTIVGFGQAGTRMADKFAEVKYTDGTPVYNCLALNSNDGDLLELQHVPRENRVSLNLGGLGKNPEHAMTILEENEEAKTKLKSFITDRIRPEDDLVLFFAGLGGGTGTSTIVKSINEFYDFHNKPLIAEELKKIQRSVDSSDFKTNLNKYKKLAFKKAQLKFVKIGVVATLPVRSDGPDVLRQVNTFANEIWKIAQNPTKGVAFVLFADNQYLYDKWSELGAKSKFENYRDYANSEIFNQIHEINIGTNSGGTSVTFDPKDFRRIIMEGTGMLVIGKDSKKMDEIQSGHDIKDMFIDAVNESTVHDKIKIEEKDEETGETVYAKVHHVGLLASISDRLSNIGSSFLDTAKNEITDILPLSGTVFSGYIIGRNNFNATVYTFYKTDALPTRLSKGLVKEYEEFQLKKRKITYKKDSIEQIAATNDEFDDLDIDLDDLGIEIEETESDTNNDDEINIDDLDLDDIDIDKLD
ncbi:hypothetical protein J2S74_002879 [Evansella vedderi]|uniref:Tubulin-like protein TubZ-like C-terminal domain-containing protein n=1 Tax=Evansella vedderi TaxID=38282 RepID=A0ABT9ZW88_9BACI|nr:cell division protein FtsZ [Evansella vedderi]MDQ0255497.1 hypothetical protein [Evansella vedderi]